MFVFVNAELAGGGHLSVSILVFVCFCACVCVCVCVCVCACVYECVQAHFACGGGGVRVYGRM